MKSFVIISRNSAIGEEIIKLSALTNNSCSLKGVS